MTLISRIWLRLLREWWNWTVPLRLRWKGVSVGAGSVFYGMPIVSLVPGSEIRIGSRVVICSDSRYTALGVSHPTVLRTLRPGASIQIGEDTGISGGSICAANKIVIGRQCLIGADVVVCDTDFHAIRPGNRRYNGSHEDVMTAPVDIHDNVFLGTRAVVLKGVTIGANSVVGAMSLVVKSFQDNKLVAGNPAKIIRDIY